MINPFIGPHGLRSGWRVLAFAFLVFLIGTITGFIVHLPPPLKNLDKGIFDLLVYSSFLLATLASMWIMARLDSKPVASYGLAPANRGRNFLVGAAVGFAALSLLIALMILAGAFRPGGLSLHGSQAVYWAIQSAILFLLVGLNEELLTRGYPLFALWQGIGFWPAAVVISLLFGAGHLFNGGENPIGLADAVLVGMVLAYSVRWSGSLWWAIGFHAAWDWGESFFYGVPNSGEAPLHHLFSGTPAGPAWLSGGADGPEGSALAAVVILALIGVVRWTTPGAVTAPAEPAAPQ